MRAIEKRLRAQINALEVERDSLKIDQQLFRDHFSRRFKWWIEMLGSGKTPSLQWLIEQDAKELRQLQRWQW